MAKKVLSSEAIAKWIQDRVNDRYFPFLTIALLIMSNFLTFILTRNVLPLERAQIESVIPSANLARVQIPNPVQIFNSLLQDPLHSSLRILFPTDQSKISSPIDPRKIQEEFQSRSQSSNRRRNFLSTSNNLAKLEGEEQAVEESARLNTPNFVSLASSGNFLSGTTKKEQEELERDTVALDLSSFTSSFSTTSSSNASQTDNLNQKEKKDSVEVVPDADANANAKWKANAEAKSSSTTTTATNNSNNSNSLDPIEMAQRIQKTLEEEVVKIEAWSLPLPDYKRPSEVVKFEFEFERLGLSEGEGEGGVGRGEWRIGAGERSARSIIGWEKIEGLNSSVEKGKEVSESSEGVTAASRLPPDLYRLILSPFHSDFPLTTQLLSPPLSTSTLEHELSLTSKLQSSVSIMKPMMKSHNLQDEIDIIVPSTYHKFFTNNLILEADYRQLIFYPYPTTTSSKMIASPPPPLQVGKESFWILYKLYRVIPAYYKYLGKDLREEPDRILSYSGGGGGCNYGSPPTTTSSPPSSSSTHTTAYNNNQHLVNEKVDEGLKKGEKEEGEEEVRGEIVPPPVEKIENVTIDLKGEGVKVVRVRGWEDTQSSGKIVEVDE